MSALSFVSATALLYAVCSILLLGSAAIVFLREPRSALHRLYALTALSLLGWVATLSLYYRAEVPETVLWLGRTNFSAAALAVTFGFLLVRSIAIDAGRNRARGWIPFAVGVEAVMLAVASALTPLIDRAELLGTAGRHVTVYGVLFPLYAAHVVGFLAASAIVAFNARSRQSDPGAVRDRLTLVGLGVLATGAVGVLTDIVLPYGFGNFRYTDWGPLSTAFFLLAVGYAVLKHRLFDLRLLIRKTLVLGLLGTLALAVYGAVVVLATDRLAGNDTVAKFAVLVIALSFDPLRRAFERKVDDVLFGAEKRKRVISAIPKRTASEE